MHYFSVAGALSAGDGSALSQRMAPGSYQAIAGCRDLKGDGLVPVQSALLDGSEQITLSGVAHGGAFGAHWYGTPAVVPQWWLG